MAQIPVLAVMDGEVTAYLIVLDDEERVKDLVAKVCYMVIDRRLPFKSSAYEVYRGEDRLSLNARIRDTSVTPLDRIDVKPILH